MFQILVSALLFTGVLGAPFLTEESANQFIRLKRQIPYSQSYWDPSSSQNAWGYAVAEQVRKSWTALRDTAQYYMDFSSFAFDPSIARYDGVSSAEHFIDSECVHVPKVTTSDLTRRCYSSLGLTSSNRQGRAIKSYMSRTWQCQDMACYVFAIMYLIK